MLQIYFLSILLNLLAGLILVYGRDFTAKDGLEPEASEIEDFDGNDEENETENGGEKDSLFDRKLQLAINSKGTFFDDGTFRLVVAILSGLTGIFKLLSAVQNDVPVIGDLFPALAGLAACGALLVEFYSSRASVGLKLPEPLTRVFVGGRKYIGIFCVIAGVLHFIFPRVLFL